MKKFLCFTIMVFTISLASPGMAADIKPYVGLNLGTVITEDTSLDVEGVPATVSSKPGFVVTGSGGLDFGAGRVEAEIGYRRADYDEAEVSGTKIGLDGTFEIVSYMVNGFVNIPLNGPVKPYLGAGIGAATAYFGEISVNGVAETESRHDTQFAYQFSAGLGYELNKNITLDGSYRYLGTTDFKIEGVTADYASHSILVGLRYAF